MTAPTMTITDLPRVRVPTPPPAAPARYGLFSAATLLEGMEGTQLAGIEYPSVCSNRVDPAKLDCGYPPPPDTVTGQKVPQPTRSMTAASPFVLYAMDSCALGVPMREQQDALRQRFTSGERVAVEDIVEKGALNNYPCLVGTAANPTELPDGEEVHQDLFEAVGKLEQWLAATTGGAGIIHVPRWLAEATKSSSLATAQGPILSTVLDNAFAFGAGYSGTPPKSSTVVDDQNVWIYATPPVTIRRTELIEPADWQSGAFNTATNEGALLVERVYVVDWPCKAAAIRFSAKRWRLKRDIDLASPSAQLEPAAHHTTSSVIEEAS